MDKLIDSMNSNIKELEQQYREETDPQIKEMIDKQMTTIKETLRRRHIVRILIYSAMLSKKKRT